MITEFFFLCWCSSEPPLRCLLWTCCGILDATRDTQSRPLLVLFVREGILIWARCQDAEEQLLRLLSSNKIVLFVHESLASAEMRSQAV